jgi:hypothetical protein
MPTSFGGRRIYTSWGVTLFYPTGAEQLATFKSKKYIVDTAEIETEMAEKSSTGTRQTDGKNWFGLGK